MTQRFTNSKFPLDDRPMQPISSLAINHSNTVVASGSYDEYTSIQLRDAKTLQLNKNAMYPHPILCVEFLNEDEYAAGTQDNLIQLYKQSSDHPFDTLRGHTDSVMSLAYNKNSITPLLISGSHDKMIKVWDLKTKRCLHTFHHSNEPTSWLNCITIRTKPFKNNQRSPLIVSGSTDGTVQIWAPYRDSPYAPYPKKTITIKDNKDVNSITFLPNHSLLIAAASIWKYDEPGSCEIYDPETGELLSTLKPINNRSRVSAVSACQTQNNATIVAGRFLEDNSIGIWDLTNKKQYCIEAPSVYHNNIGILVLAHKNNLILFYDTEDDSSNNIHSVVKRKKIKLVNAKDSAQ